LIGQCGEFLPVYSENYQGYLFNTLALEDSALNPKLCQKNEWGEISWLAFNEAKVESTVFRTEDDNFMSVFCTEALINAYKAANLTGLVFTENLAPEPVWRHIAVPAFSCRTCAGRYPVSFLHSPPKTPDLRQQPRILPIEIPTLKNFDY
jgi:hypothetical protein